jgi:biotin synthase-like enzyme
MGTKIKVNFQPAKDCYFCAVGRHRECTQSKTAVRDVILHESSAQIQETKECICWVRNGRPTKRHSARVIDDAEAVLNILGGNRPSGY